MVLQEINHLSVMIHETVHFRIFFVTIYLHFAWLQLCNSVCCIRKCCKITHQHYDSTQNVVFWQSSELIKSGIHSRSRTEACNGCGLA